jgi:sec-independent protein translocase protein TatA
MGSVGSPEILVILVIALLLFGPTKLPEMGKALGKAIKEFKRATSELQDTIEREVEDLKQDVKEGPGQQTSARPKGALPSPKPRAANAPPEESSSVQESEPASDEVKNEKPAQGATSEINNVDPPIPGPPEERG